MSYEEGNYVKYSNFVYEFKCDEITTPEQRYNIINNNRVVCIYVGAVWCGPCKKCGPEYNKLADEYNNKGVCMLVKEDIDLELAKEFEIKGIPSFVFYVNRELQPNIHVGTDMLKLKEILNGLLITK
jgi:thioredoxin 1